MALLRRVATLGGWTLGSRLLGFLRDRLLAGAFGGSALLDAFIFAFQLPNLLRNLFGEGALAAAFIPRYVQLRESDQAEGERFAGAVLLRLAFYLSVIAAFGMALAGVLLVWGPSSLVPVAALALPQLPFLIFICCSAIMAGVLNGRRHFAVPAAAPILLNCCLIAAVLIWEDVWVLPYAVLVTGLLQVVLHILALLKTDGGLPPLRGGQSKHLKDLWQALIPTVIASSVYQFNALLDTIIAFFLVPGAGAVVYLYFGNRLLQFPLALVGHGVGTAIYPELATAASKESKGEPWQQTGNELRRGSGVLAGLLFPAACGLALTADPLVRTLYQTGAFMADDVARTVLVTQCFALSLIPIGFSKLFIRAFLAHRDQSLPLRIGLGTVALNLVLNLILVQTVLQEAGLALASGISGVLACVLYVWQLHRRGTGALLDWRAMFMPIMATGIMSAVVWYILYLWPAEVATGTPTWHHGMRLAASVGAGIAVYGILAGPGAWRRMKRRG